MTNIFKSRVEILEPKEDKWKSSAAAKKSTDKKVAKKQRRVDSNSNVIESSEELSVEHRLVKKLCAKYMKNAVILQTSTKIYLQW